MPINMSGTECGWKAVDPSLCFPSDFIWSFKSRLIPVLTPVGTAKPFGSGLECWGRCFSVFSQGCCGQQGTQVPASALALIVLREQDRKGGKAPLSGNIGLGLKWEISNFYGNLFFYGQSPFCPWHLGTARSPCPGKFCSSAEPKSFSWEFRISL